MCGKPTILICINELNGRPFSLYDRKNSAAIPTAKIAGVAAYLSTTRNRLVVRDPSASSSAKNFAGMTQPPKMASASPPIGSSKFDVR